VRTLRRGTLEASEAKGEPHQCLNSRP